MGTSCKSRKFIVQRYLHMGLRVKPNCTYTEEELIARCEGEGAKIARLTQMLKDPTMLLEVGGFSKRKFQAKAMMKKNQKTPSLDCGLRAFYINLRRRPDRRAHIERVCAALGIKAERVEAVDGHELASRRGSSIECVKASNGEGWKPQPTGPNVGSFLYKATWKEDTKQRSHLMAMSPHRVEATNYTKEGHELWGAIGCSMSHQSVMRRITLDKRIDWALVLEDDGHLIMPGCDAQKLFDEGMRAISEDCPDWGLVYLGGSLSTFFDPKTGAPRSHISESDRLNDSVIKGKQMYQTHAYLIRRTICKDIMKRLKAGQAADAALVSWCRQNASRCFSFHPRQILIQSADRYKDSDIFVEGEHFKIKETKKRGAEYAFAPRLQNFNRVVDNRPKRAKKH